MKQNLSELIKQCPVRGIEDTNKTFTLTFSLGRWIAGFEAYEDWESLTYGDTPEEAVSNLISNLNKK